MSRFLSILFLAFVSTAASYGQQVGLKTNLLYWGTTTPNLSVEIALGRKTSLEITGSYNPWQFGKKDDNKKVKHWVVMPELRFWPYEKFDGHFLGFHGLYTQYNAGGVNLPLWPLSNLKTSRYEGYGTGAGFVYGYQWYLGPHWNLELSVGLGYMYFNYKRYECRRCGNYLDKGTKHWVGPTKIGVSFTYLFKSKKS